MREILNAMAYAETIQEPGEPWLHVILNIGQSDFLKAPGCCPDDPRPYLNLQVRILRAVRDFLENQGIPYRCIWTRECGPRYSRQHTHALLFAPPALATELAELIRRVGGLHGRDVYISSNGSRGISSPAARAGVLRDLLECASPRARAGSTVVWGALGIEARRGKGCTILGKRSGTSGSLGRAARAAAGWVELHALPDLRAVMPTKAEARRVRNRAYKRRRRAMQDRTTRPPQPCSKPILANLPDPFDVGDLAADFLD